jgi:hypothetical protein
VLKGHKKLKRTEDTIKFVGIKPKENEESTLNGFCKLILTCRMI